MTVPYTFKNAVGTIPLSQLDDNFTAVVSTSELSSASGAMTVGFAPTGTISSTTVASAINELDTEKATTASVALKVNSADLSASTGASLIGTIQGVTGSVQRTVASKLKDCVSVRDFGAIGNGVADESAAVQLAINYAETISAGVYFPSGTYLFNSTVTFTKKWCIYGDGASTILKTYVDIPIITLNPIGQGIIYFWEIKDIHFMGPYTAVNTSCAIRVIGDNNFISYGNCTVSSDGFYSFFKNENGVGSTVGAIVWCKFNCIIQNVTQYGYWFTTGSGTGNIFDGIIMTRLSTGACMCFEGTNYNVGDLIISGHWGSQVVGGTGVIVGDNTKYRSRINLSQVQFDANCDYPLKLSSVGTTPYYSIIISDNNMGGAVSLGNNLQPLNGSIIVDKEVSSWKCGIQTVFNSIGTISSDLFYIDFSAYGSVNVFINISGVVAGVGSHSSYLRFVASEALGTLSIDMLDKVIGKANGFSLSITTSGTRATVLVTYTSTGTGTTLNTTLEATGNKFKVTSI